MCFFRKKKTSKEQVVEDIKLVKSNQQQIRVLWELAEGNDELRQRLSKLKETLTYLNPSESAEIKKLDQQIGDKIEDFKMVLSKAAYKDGEASDWKKYVKELEVLTAERNARII